MERITAEEKARNRSEWIRKNRKTYAFNCYLKDKELIEWLESKTNKQATIKTALEREMWLEKNGR